MAKFADLSRESVRDYGQTKRGSSLHGSPNEATPGTSEMEDSSQIDTLAEATDGPW
jgi:hypothetical protein